MSAHALFLARNFKGNEAFRAARALGFRPLLLTTEALIAAVAPRFVAEVGP